MTNLIRIALVASIVLGATSAQAAVSNRAECYDVVIAHCNATAGDNAQSCAKGGMDQCDKEFKQFKVPTTRNVPGFKAN